MSFCINCLEITATKEQWKRGEKGLYKRLLSEKDYDVFEREKTDSTETFKKRFFFNDFYEHNQHGELEKNESNDKFKSDLFYGKNINIQAIVGQNGAGKSSLMDLMYVTINNFACIFAPLMPRCVYFARGVYVNIYFNIGSLEYVLKCEDTHIKLHLKRIITKYRRNGYEKDVMHFEPLTENESIFVAKEIFYTIVTNYSILSLIPSNYNANCIELLLPKKNDKWSAVSSPGCWIHRIFHKNDGYVCPIVLNPMRDNGTIDVEKEMRLSRDRLLSLLIFAKKHGYSFDDRYELNRIEVCFRNDLALQKLSQKWDKFKNIDENKNVKPKDWDEIIKIVDEWLEDSNSVSNIIIKQFGLKISIASPEVKKIALAYLQNKILSLPKYYFYAKFSKGGLEDLEIKEIDNVNKIHLEGLINDIFLDSSHAVTKIHQVVNFLHIKDDDKLFANHGPWEIFDYEEYYKGAVIRYIDENKKELNDISKEEWNYFNPSFIHARPWDGDTIDKDWNFSLDEIIECLPPPVLDYRIFLYDKVADKEILYNRMSSGELQLLQTISTHLYHVRNIMSVNGSRLRYENINMIFDELEISFHPEYQRLFVKKLIDIITNLKLNETHSFNIFLITHSPFILSDIPQENVMYLKEGSQEERYGETFAGNLGELLESGFFLNGTIGNFAGWKINRLIENIEKGTVSENDRLFVEKVGDSLLKSLLKRKLPREVCNDKN